MITQYKGIRTFTSTKQDKVQSNISKKTETGPTTLTTIQTKW